MPPTDSLQDLRSEIVKNLMACGLTCEVQHHEVATGGQSEIGLRFDTLVRMGDAVSIFKYVVKNTARAFGKTATFMPKPIFGDNGSGMHVHISLWRGDKNLFAGPEYGGLSETALYFIGGPHRARARAPRPHERLDESRTRGSCRGSRRP